MIQKIHSLSMYIIECVINWMTDQRTDKTMIAIRTKRLDISIVTILTTINWCNEKEFSEIRILKRAQTRVLRLTKEINIFYCL